MWPKQKWGQRSSGVSDLLVKFLKKVAVSTYFDVLWWELDLVILQWLQKYVIAKADETRNSRTTLFYRPFSYCIDQARLGAFTAKSGHKYYNPPPLTVMWMNFDSPNFPSLCSLSAIISFQTCSNKCILYVLLFHKCIKIKYKTVNMYGVFLWLVQSSSCWNTIHSHRNYHVQLLSVRVGEFCHPARSR